MAGFKKMVIKIITFICRSYLAFPGCLIPNIFLRKILPDITAESSCPITPCYYWGNWTETSPCSQTCDYGARTMTRLCEEVEEAGGSFRQAFSTHLGSNASFPHCYPEWKRSRMEERTEECKVNDCIRELIPIRTGKYRKKRSGHFH